MNKISIIVPVYNVEMYLDKCLNSLLNQTAKDFEVIVINDGTKDNSQKIIDDYVTKDKRFKGFIKENGGLSDARNYGIEQATGDYYLFIDSDDYVEETLVEECLKLINEYDLIIFEYKQHDLQKNTVETIVNKFEENKVYSLQSNPELLNDIDNCAWNKCYRKELFSNLKYPKGYLYEDLGTTYQILNEAKSVGFINKPLINYLLNRDGNITTTVNDKLFNIFDMCKVNIEYYQKENKFNEYKARLEKLCWVNIVECLRKLPQSATKEFTYSFIDMAFDFMKYHFGKKNVKINSRFIDNVYEYRSLCKLYMKYRGFKNE